MNLSLVRYPLQDPAHLRQRLNGSISEAHLHEAGLAQMVRCKDQNADLGFGGALSFLIML